MSLMSRLRGGRTTSVRAVGMGMELVHALFNGNKHVQVAERELEKRVGTPTRLSPGDPGKGPLDLPDDWKRKPRQ
jgi:hypothetical protein